MKFANRSIIVVLEEEGGEERKKERRLSIPFWIVSRFKTINSTTLDQRRMSRVLLKADIGMSRGEFSENSFDKREQR